jgi:hypothetical protein
VQCLDSEHGAPRPVVHPTPQVAPALEGETFVEKWENLTAKLKKMSPDDLRAWMRQSLVQMQADLDAQRAALRSKPTTATPTPASPPEPVETEEDRAIREYLDRQSKRWDRESREIILARIREEQREQEDQRRQVLRNRAHRARANREWRTGGAPGPRHLTLVAHG